MKLIDLLETITSTSSVEIYDARCSLIYDGHGGKTNFPDLWQLPKWLVEEHGKREVIRINAKIDRSNFNICHNCHGTIVICVK